IPVSLLQSLRIIGRTRPALVVGVGGYASGPVLVAAVLRRVPTLIHEQNYVPGATNRWMAPFVTDVVVTFEETVGKLGGRGVALGNPVRRDFTLVKPRPAGDPVRHLLVFGGSQGARRVNRAMVDALPRLVTQADTLRIVHQTGESERDSVAAAYELAGFTRSQADVRAFISGMSAAFEQADLIVSRSGATTVAELTASGRPAVLVPFAGAAHDHQTWNARKLADAGAAVMIAEKDLSGATLASTIVDLLADRERLAAMSRAGRSLARPDAAARIADRCAALMAAGRAA
ncbi:MAG TPA: UDP-N-acetylglucosamine--N-acetylmuramyl-(pentapeptide) pyrophosphoryl-undecaprenol N-acetylglucosamine transferase, partial [Candidatus Polarisedimenticolia bacterium]|nr:UDP-N-acetylglucosamine--N-acetylmuramyl-(pentapeptide) pyrophosphoryl-undecaprenol N-acetylglucosamine transferase [Candidatus Polarisedimenticolia bacterium]